MLKTMRNLTLIFIIVVILGFTLMVLTYTIPTENAYNQVVEDAKYIDELYYENIPTYISTQFDMFTDMIILSELSYYNDNATLLENAMAVYGTSASTFDQYTSGNESGIDQYARYWHGNLVVFKPLFTFLDYNAVKILQLFFELVMIIGICKLMLDKNFKNYIVPFLLSLFFVHLEVIGLSLQFSSMLNLMLISTFILLYFDDYLLKNNRMFYYFLVVGMATSYFDLTTYPLVSFGVPMAFYFMFEADKQSLKDNILKIILFGLVWTVGYVGMWVSKWIIASVILDFNVVQNALNQLAFRTSTMGPESSFPRHAAILRNMMVYKKRPYLIVMALIAVYYIKRIISNRKNISKEKIKHAIPFALIAATPFVWYYVISNHSYIHYWFTHRELLIFFFAAMCCLEYILRKKSV